MCICEYCNVLVWRKLTDKFDDSHNLQYSAIKVTKRGLTACFISDKTSKAGDPIKRCSVFWRKLPAFAKPVMLAYKILRKGTNYFCKEDGTSLDRNDFLNILEPCLLHTSWCHLVVTPHSFRQGRASTEVNEGVSIEEIKHSCRWSNTSKAFDAYCRTDLVMMRPDAIYREYPQCRKTWTTKRLSWITHHFVQTSGDYGKHPHHVMLSEEFPEQFEEMKKLGELPNSYPDTECVIHMRTQKVDRESEIFIKAQEKEEEQKEWKIKRREIFVAACRRTASARKYDFYKNRSMAGMAGPNPAHNLSDFINKAVAADKQEGMQFFSGKKSRISRVSKGARKFGAKFDMALRRTSGITNKGTQTGPVKKTGHSTQRVQNDESSWPKVMYQGAPRAVHEDALDLIPKVDYYQFEFRESLGTCKLMLVEGTREQVKKGKTRSIWSRQCITHAIKKRISPRYRMNNANRASQKRFSVTKSHARLVHHFTLECMVKGVDGLPIEESEVDPDVMDDEYEQRVFVNYDNKPENYEFFADEHVTAEYRLRYRKTTKKNKQEGTSYHKAGTPCKSERNSVRKNGDFVTTKPLSVVLEKLSKKQIEAAVRGANGEQDRLQFVDNLWSDDDMDESADRWGTNAQGEEFLEIALA